MYRVITVPGIGEAPSMDGKPVGTLKYFTDALPANRFIGNHFNWTNSYGPVPVWNSPAYDKNLIAGTEALKNVIKASKEKVVLTGYSGGAHLASLAAVDSTNLAAIVLFSNPSRRTGDSIAPHYGITGQHGPFPIVPFYDVANPADVICCCPQNSPLRDFADLSGHFSLVDPISWGQEMYSATLSGKEQGAFPHAKLNDWLEALAYVRGYLFDGQHTRWYLNQLPVVAANVASRLA